MPANMSRHKDARRRADAHLKADADRSHNRICWCSNSRCRSRLAIASSSRGQSPYYTYSHTHAHTHRSSDYDWFAQVLCTFFLFYLHRSVSARTKIIARERTNEMTQIQKFTIKPMGTHKRLWKTTLSVSFLKKARDEN